MNLQTLCATPTVAVYYDTCNNWLFLEWEGELTLQSVKRDALAIARCFIGHNYPRVLNSNAYLTGMTWDATGWLVPHMTVFLGLAGVRQFAWVHAPSLRGQDMAEEIAQRLTQELTLDLALFVDMEQAVSWLQQTKPDCPGGCATMPRPAEVEAQLVQLVEEVSKQLHAEELAG